MANETRVKFFNKPIGICEILQRRIIKLLDEQGPLPRKEIVNALKTPRTTVYDNLLKLQRRRVVEKFIKNSGKRGRPIVFWKLKEVEYERM